MAVQCTVSSEDGLMFAHLEGPLDGHGIAALRNNLLKCLAEQPEALIVDLAGVLMLDPLAMTVFVAVRRQAALWPGTPVLLCAPSAPTAAVLCRAAYRQIPVFADADAARTEARNHRVVLPSVRDELLPVVGAARLARDVVTDACLRWNLPHLVGPASTVAGEFVANAVTHAATTMALRLSLSERYLHVAVRDGSPAEPVLDGAGPAASGGGLGLHLVEAVSSSWGFLPATDGKVVWATLAL
jgi:anti-anti-sigma regulatory factor